MILYGWVREVSSHRQADVDCSTGTVPLIREKIYDLPWLDDPSIGTSPLLLIQMLIVPPGCILHTLYQINLLRYPFNFRENICFGMVDWALWVGFRFLLFSGRCWLFHRAASSTLLLSSLMTPSLYYAKKYDLPWLIDLSNRPLPLIQMSTVLQRCILHIFYLIPVRRENSCIWSRTDFDNICTICKYFKFCGFFLL